MNPFMMQDYRFADVMEFIEAVIDYSPNETRSNTKTNKPTPKRKRVSVKVTDA